MAVAKLLFGLPGRVGRGAYATIGFGLAGLKYAVDAAVVHAWAGSWISPLAYLSPLWTSRVEWTDRLPTPVLVLLGAWTLPFLWIGVNVTRKRVIDAGLSPWLALLFFVPLANYVVMLAFCMVPSRQAAAKEAAPQPPGRGLPAIVSLAVVLGIAAGGVVLLASVYLFGSYGLALFAGSPFTLGLVSTVVFERYRTRPVAHSLGVAATTLVVACAALLLFALEGGICLTMALPLLLPLALLGSLTGHALVRHGHDAASVAAALTLVLPGAAGLEAERPPAVYETVSWIEIDAPRERVWEHVTSFSELPPPSRLLFRAGIAYPRHARIDGSGVGAVRHCVFSTGSFVEPITRWDEPERLSFDVVAQPPPMQEWSPWAVVAPPHLDGYFRSRRGEFRLIDLGEGRTRLEGSTVYELRIHPTAYWRLWSDAAVSRIHGRVLEHIRREAEAGAGR